MDRGAWWAEVHGVSKSRTRLSDFTFTSHFHALEKEMATHSSVLAWRIPGMGEPGGLLSMGSHRVGHDWSDLVAAAASIWVFSESVSSHFSKAAHSALFYYYYCLRLFSCVVVFVAVVCPVSLQDLNCSSPRDWTVLLAVKAWSLNHWTTSKFPSAPCFF